MKKVFVVRKTGREEKDRREENEEMSENGKSNHMVLVLIMLTTFSLPS